MFGEREVLRTLRLLLKLKEKTSLCLFMIQLVTKNTIFNAQRREAFFRTFPESQANSGLLGSKAAAPIAYEAEMIIFKVRNFQTEP